MISANSSSRTPARLLRILPVLALALLAGCGKSSIRSEIPKLICPAVGLVKDTTTLTRFREGGSYDTDDVLYSAFLSRMTSNCAKDGNEIIADIAFNVTGVKGPASGTDQISLPYFVAVTTQGGGILSKQVYNSVIDLSKGGRGSVREHLNLHLDAGETKDLHDYEVLIGFQLSDDDLVYNLAH